MEIKKGNTIINDTMDRIRLMGDKIECCGPMTMTMHLDGDKFFTSQYRCECGNVIEVTTRRQE